MNIQDMGVDGLRSALYEKQLQAECMVDDIWGPTTEIEPVSPEEIQKRKEEYEVTLQKMKAFEEVMKVHNVTLDDIKDYFDLVDEDEAYE